MKGVKKIKPIVLSLVAGVLVSIGQTGYAHTRLEIPQISEAERVYNNVVIGHGCNTSGKGVIGTSVVFPDGVDSTILVDGVAHTGPLTDFVENWGNLNQKILNRAVFPFEDEKVDPLGNVVGFWAGGGEGMPAHLVALVPFRTSAVTINPDSCASSVKFTVSIINVCEITTPDAFVDGETVGLWTHNDLGTVYDRQSESDDGPASLTVNRVSALPESCGDGVAVEVKPSAAQINRDMPIIIDGVQVWPQ